MVAVQVVVASVKLSLRRGGNSLVTPSPYLTASGRTAQFLARAGERRWVLGSPTRRASPNSRDAFRSVAVEHEVPVRTLRNHIQ